MTPDAWLATRTFTVDVDPAAVGRALRARPERVSVVIPTREVAATIGPICRSIRERWMGAGGLVSELVVVDADSADGTAGRARDAGATVVAERDVRPDVAGAGKGAAMWRGLVATSGDIIVFLDGDVPDFDALTVPRLLAPLVDPDIHYVKGFGDRPVAGTDIGGGRVSEICARPLINRHRPELAGFVHPLAGEAAGRRAVLERVPFATGYAVEIALLWDIHSLVGLPGLAQVDLGPRRHHNQPTVDLGPMAAAIDEAVLRRADPSHRPDPRLRYARPVARGGVMSLARTIVEVDEMPPVAAS